MKEPKHIDQAKAWLHERRHLCAGTGLHDLRCKILDMARNMDKIQAELDKCKRDRQGRMFGNAGAAAEGAV